MSFRSSNSFSSAVWFIRLWIGVALIVAMLACLEMAFLAATGYRYRSKQYVEHVALRDLSIVDPHIRASIFCYRQRDSSKPIWPEMALHDGSDIPHRFRLEAVEPHRVALSSNRSLAVSTAKGEILLRQLPKPPLRLSALTRLPTLATTSDKAINNLTFSPDGRYLACGSQDQLWVWDANTREQMAVSCSEGLLCFFPDSNRILSTPQPGVLRIHEIATPHRTQDIHVDDDQIVAAVISPNADRILLSSTHGKLFVWSLTENRLLWKKHSTPQPRSLAIGDDFTAFVASNGKNVMICDPETGHDPTVALQHERQVHGLTLMGMSQLYAWDISGQIQLFDTNTKESVLLPHSTDEGSQALRKSLNTPCKGNALPTSL